MSETSEQSKGASECVGVAGALFVKDPKYVTAEGDPQEDVSDTTFFEAADNELVVSYIEGGIKFTPGTNSAHALAVLEVLPRLDPTQFEVDERPGLPLAWEE